MEQFMNDVRLYAEQMGVHPSTVVQRAAKVSGGAWARWEAGDASPTLRVADKIRQYMRDNPPVSPGPDCSGSPPRSAA
ncbi:helix-turn-helix transcriptional regulator [Limimaricola cinnabarinus]|uniref:helix-turn-helix transcriptional regulator n=1 Tax=Limimaricola cinnabarinus TaxID=1125964 RepID=UPI002FE2005E